MIADKHYPENLNLWELDQYLEKAWYRMGQLIFTTHFLFFGKSVFSALWLRLPLFRYVFQGSNRKLLQRIRERFQVHIRPMTFSNEKEDLYARYAERFDGTLAPSLQEMLLEYAEESIYDTWEVAVYDGEQLVACSFFDRGFHSLASIFAMYAPDYERHSLGYFTLLAEVAYALDNEYTYFYPGYVVPGNPRFDYKLRIGGVEYYDLKTEKWQPFQAIQPDRVPIWLIQQKLDTLQGILEGAQLPAIKLNYTFFDINLVSLGLINRNSYLEYPVILYLPGTRFIVITFDPRTELYHLLRCRDLFEEKQVLSEFLILKNDEAFFNHLVVIEEILESSPNAQTICRAVGTANMNSA